MAVDTQIKTLERKLGEDEGSVVRKYREMKKQTAEIEALLKRNERCTKVSRFFLQLTHLVVHSESA